MIWKPIFQLIFNLILTQNTLTCSTIMYYKYSTLMYYKYKIAHLDDLQTNFSTAF